MRKGLVVVMAMLMVTFATAGNAWAESSLREGAFGFTVKVVNFDEELDNEDSMISGRYLIQDNMAVLAGFGLNFRGRDADGTDVALMGGIRHYLNTSSFAPFVGGYLEHHRYNDGDSKVTSLVGEFGVEYFLARQFSIEGSIGLGYTLKDEGPADFSRLGTRRSGVSITYYF